MLLSSSAICMTTPQYRNLETNVEISMDFACYCNIIASELHEVIYFLDIQFSLFEVGYKKNPIFPIFYYTVNFRSSKIVFQSHFAAGSILHFRQMSKKLI